MSIEDHKFSDGWCNGCELIDDSVRLLIENTCIDLTEEDVKALAIHFEIISEEFSNG